jgi:hypothetical protein
MALVDLDPVRHAAEIVKPEEAMNETEKVYTESRALIGWDLLPEHVRHDIRTTLARYADELLPASSERIRAWNSEQGLFVLPVWVDETELLVFFRKKPQQISIEGLHRAELLALLGKRKAVVS